MGIRFVDDIASTFGEGCHITIILGVFAAIADKFLAATLTVNIVIAHYIRG